jgi:hypothetical protein
VQDLLGGLTIIGACSGDEFFADTVVQKLNEQFDTSIPDLTGIKNEIERIVRESCQAAWPLFEGKDRPTLQVLIGARGIDGTGLIEVNGPLVRSIEECAFIGYGTDLAKYKSKFSISRVYPCEAMLPVVIYILKVVKENALYCGGDTSVWVLNGDGSVEVKDASYIKKFETTHSVLERLWEILSVIIPYMPPHSSGKTMMDILLENAGKLSDQNLHVEILKFLAAMQAKELKEQNPTEG